MKSPRRSLTLLSGLACLALVAPTGPRAPFADTPTAELAPELEPELAPELELLRPFLGSWIGHFDDPEATMDIFSTWSEVLGGQAIREVRTVPDAGAFESETLYYLDRETGTIATFSVANTGYVTRSHITYEDGRFVTVGRQVQPDGSVRDTDGTYTFMDDGTLVNEGGHKITFQRR